MGGLPKNWVECQLDEIALVQSGGTPPRGNKNYWNGEIPWIKISDIKELYVNEASEFISSEGLENSSARIFPKGTILFTIFATIGRIGILNIDAATNQAIAGITPNNLVNHKYITFALIDLSNSILEQGKGVAQKNINQAILKSTKIPLPPLPEQNRIVAKLDLLFGQLEAIKAGMEKIPVLLKEFRQQVLSQAVSGRLTEEWRVGKEFDSPNSILDELIAKRKDSYTLQCQAIKSTGAKKPAVPEYLNYSKKDVTTHSIGSWFIAPVGFLCDCIVPGRDKPKSFTGDIPWITTPDLTENYISEKNAKLFLSKHEIKEVNAKVIPVDSVIISIVGKFGISCLTKSECVINQQLHAFLPTEIIQPKYLMYHIKTQETYLKHISSSTTIAYINKSKANRLPINVPPVEEQQEIVSRVESLFAKADAIEAQYLALKQKIDGLPQAILHKAFKGELVEQLESDGDARALLKEIEGLKKEVKPKKEKLRMVAEGKQEYVKANE